MDITLQPPVEFGPNRPPKSYELYAASRYIGDKCFDMNLAFFKCKDEHDHPLKCLEEGKAVHACVYTALHAVQAKAPAEFQRYGACLALQSLKMENCRALQLQYEAAVYGK
jgi:NADH dehydrogenase (ubiquinone) 1 alpha subcomplex subunit 8